MSFKFINKLDAEYTAAVCKHSPLRYC